MVLNWSKSEKNSSLKLQSKLDEQNQDEIALTEHTEALNQEMENLKEECRKLEQQKMELNRVHSLKQTFEAKKI